MSPDVLTIDFAVIVFVLSGIKSAASKLHRIFSFVSVLRRLFVFLAGTSIYFIARVGALEEIDQLQRVIGGCHPLGRV